MRINDRFRPTTLQDVVGQTPVALLKHLVANPHSSALLLEGPPGCGKTSSAVALAHDMGCDNEWSGLEVIPATELTIDRARELFLHDLKLRPLEGRGWHVLILEELEAVHPQVSRFMKVHLERLPKRCIVIATSNGAGGVEEALLQRFRLYRFAGDESFAAACQARVASIWREIGAGPLPRDWMAWGWRSGTWSLRLCLDELADFAQLAGGVV